MSLAPLVLEYGSWGGKNKNQSGQLSIDFGQKRRIIGSIFSRDELHLFCLHVSWAARRVPSSNPPTRFASPVRTIVDSLILATFPSCLNQLAFSSVAVKLFFHLNPASIGDLALSEEHLLHRGTPRYLRPLHSPLSQAAAPPCSRPFAFSRTNVRMYWYRI